MHQNQSQSCECPDTGKLVETDSCGRVIHTGAKDTDIGVHLLKALEVQRQQLGRPPDGV